MPQQMPNIEIQFPKGDAETRKFYNRLVGLLVDVPEGAMVDDDIAFASHVIPGALPHITMCESSVAFPQVVFAISAPLDITLGQFAVRSSGTTGKQPERSQPGTMPVTPSPPRFTLEAIGDKLHSHLVRLDHLGINLPSALLDLATWQTFITTLAPSTTLYRYPTGAEWPFILPATPAEFAGSITMLTLSREPKFAVVYDTYLQIPTLQIGIATNLTQQELAAILPEPFGFTTPELAEHCRSTLIASPWPGLQVRFDCRYRSATPTAWDTGAWLVNTGGRITGAP